MTNADCGDGKYCWGVHENFCGSIPKRRYKNPVQSNIWQRCGASEIHARTFCGAPCSWNEPCLEPEETCHSLRSNLCGSEYTEDEATEPDLFDEEFCTECTDIPTPWISTNGLTCASASSGSLITRCSQNDWWVTNNFCEKSCFDLGFGYDWSQCCTTS